MDEVSGTDAPETGAPQAAPNPDRVWRVARWVVAVPAFIVSVAVLVVSAFALYYAHKTSTETVRAGIVRTCSNVQRQLSETEQLIRQANQTLTEVQGNAKGASQTQANLTKALTELQTSLDQATQSLTEGAKTQQQILSELTAISSQLDAIEQSQAKPTPPVAGTSTAGKTSTTDKTTTTDNTTTEETTTTTG